MKPPLMTRVPTRATASFTNQVIPAQTWADLLFLSGKHQILEKSLSSSFKIQLSLLGNFNTMSKQTDKDRSMLIQSIHKSKLG